ncbi:MAG: hypothetical protein Q7S22_08690 [Candidatus Micrarchaeota archaeon]|nr:hypothetical protein [Candidatus Micrarchaeota archaeon]
MQAQNIQMVKPVFRERAKAFLQDVLPERLMIAIQSRTERNSFVDSLVQEHGNNIMPRYIQGCGWQERSEAANLLKKIMKRGLRVTGNRLEVRRAIEYLMQNSREMYAIRDLYQSSSTFVEGIIGDNILIWMSFDKKNNRMETKLILVDRNVPHGHNNVVDVIQLDIWRTGPYKQFEWSHGRKYVNLCEINEIDPEKLKREARINLLPLFQEAQKLNGFLHTQ